MHKESEKRAHTPLGSRALERLRQFERERGYEDAGVVPLEVPEEISPSSEADQGTGSGHESEANRSGGTTEPEEDKDTDDRTRLCTRRPQ